MKIGIKNGSPGVEGDARQTWQYRFGIQEYLHKPSWRREFFPAQLANEQVGEQPLSAFFNNGAGSQRYKRVPSALQSFDLHHHRIAIGEHPTTLEEDLRCPNKDVLLWIDEVAASIDACQNVQVTGARQRRRIDI